MGSWVYGFMGFGVLWVIGFWGFWVIVLLLARSMLIKRSVEVRQQGEEREAWRMSE